MPLFLYISILIISLSACRSVRREAAAFVDADSARVSAKVDASYSSSLLRHDVSRGDLSAADIEISFFRPDSLPPSAVVPEKMTIRSLAASAASSDSLSSLSSHSRSSEADSLAASRSRGVSSTFAESDSRPPVLLRVILLFVGIFGARWVCRRLKDKL